MCPLDHIAAVTVPDSGDVSHGFSPSLIADLAAANHILFAQGVMDAFGHVSVRHDTRPDRFLLARNMAPGAVTAADVVELDLDTGLGHSSGRSLPRS